MYKLYLFIYADSIGTREQVKGYLMSMPEVAFWRYDISNCFYIKSRSTAQELTEALVVKLGAEKRFLFAEISTANMQGYMLQKSWDFFHTLDIHPA